MSSVLWDPTDDLAVEQLLLTAGWGVEVIGRCRGTYECCCRRRPQARHSRQASSHCSCRLASGRPRSRTAYSAPSSAAAHPRSRSRSSSSASSRSTRQRPTAAYGMASAHNTFSGRTTRTRTGYSSRTSSRNYFPMYALLMATRHCRQRTRSPRRPPWHSSWRGRSSAVQHPVAAA